MEQQQPLFQEAARCDVNRCSFTNFRHRHHCRCCGRTLCSDHLSGQMNLPQLGINSPVRVCADCFNDSSRYGDHVAKPSINGADQIADSVAGLDISHEAVPGVEPVAQGNPKCKCGMPLCICEAPGPSTDSILLQGKNHPISSQPSTKPKKIDTVAKTRPSSSSNRNPSTSNSGQTANGTSGKPKMDYDVNGEELAGTGIYLNILQKTTENLVNNEDVTDEDLRMMSVAEEKLASFCEQMLKEASAFRSYAADGTDMDSHRILELRSPVIVKGMSFMKDKIFRRHLREFYPLLTKLVCCDQMDVRGALGDLFKAQLVPLLPSPEKIAVQ